MCFGARERARESERLCCLRAFDINSSHQHVRRSCNSSRASVLRSVSTLQRRYGLTGTSTGMLATIYHLVAVLYVLVIAVRGGARGARKPAWLGAGLLALGVGCFVFALPQLAGGSYAFSGRTDTVRTCTRALVACNRRTLSCCHGGPEGF